MHIHRQLEAGPIAPAPEGRQSLHITGQGTCRVIQEVAVRPQGQYRGYVLARIGPEASAEGSAWAPGTSAVLRLEELGPTGQGLASHAAPAISQPGPWQIMARQITTGPQTLRLRWVLEARLPDSGPRGWISLDQAVLDGPPAPAVLAGRILDVRQRPVAQALVTLAGRSLRTGPDGAFYFDRLEDLSAVELRAEKQGYYPQVRPMVLQAGENRLDLPLVPLPTNNLLANGDFEQGFAAARSVEHGVTGKRGAWEFAFSPHVACYIYPESIYTWRKPRVFRGKEAISHVTDGGGELRLSQVVPVNPNTALYAAVWVLGLDVAADGRGFGAAADDFAGLEIEELDTAGRVVVRHPPAGIRKAARDFQGVSLSFTTHRATAKVRFILRSKMGCTWQQGAAIFDDAALLEVGDTPATPQKSPSGRIVAPGKTTDKDGSMKVGIKGA